MKVTWLGHASFLLVSSAGVRIITDPYTPGMYGLDYDDVNESADIVAVSHEHGDHNNVAAVKGNPQIIRGAGSHEAKGITFRGVAAYHDASKGGERGENTMFCFAVDGVNVCHVGDLGHELDDDAVAEIGQVDLLLLPVGGNFTIDAKVAGHVCEKLRPKVVIPMHFKNDRCPTFPVAEVDEFLGACSNVKTLEGSEVEITADALPAATETIVLQPAR
jgi:L-ascorbate metabolism protein UlaG (beta-lactamase superfamily)